MSANYIEFTHPGAGGTVIPHPDGLSSKILLQVDSKLNPTDLDAWMRQALSQYRVLHSGNPNAG